MSNRYEEVLNDAKHALKASFNDSLINAGKSLLGIATILALLAGGMQSLQAFDEYTFRLFVLIGFILSFFAFLFFEAKRLGEVRDSLKSVLEVEKNYEMLLDEARRERDILKNKVTELELQKTTMIMGARLIEELKIEFFKAVKGGENND